MARYAAILGLLLLASCATGDERRQATRPDGRLFLKVLRERGEPVVSVDPAGGRHDVVPYSRVTGGDPPFQLAVSGGYVVFYGARGYSGGDGVYAVRAGRPRLLGRTSYFIPSATDGRIWFVRPASVRELTVPAGRVTVQGRRSPCRGLSTLAAVEGALLCQARTELRVFDPDSGRVLLRLPGPFPVATAGRMVAWCTDACRRVHVTDVPGGRTDSIAPGRAFDLEATYEGAFSPDGSLLAMPALERRGGLREHRRVALIDVRARRSRLVPGARLGGYRQLAWSPSGRWLLFTAGNRRLMAWLRGSERTVELPVRARGTIMDIATSR